MSPTPLAAPDVTLTIRRSKRSSDDVIRVTQETDSSGQKSEPSKVNEEDSEQKETIYESLNNFNTELSIAKENQFHYGVKLVRGAYIEGERALADQHNWPNPVWENKELTDANYDDIAAALIGEAANSRLECVLAGHNEQSILLAIDRLNQQPGWSIYCLFCIPNCTNITCRTI